MDQGSRQPFLLFFITTSILVIVMWPPMLMDPRSQSYCLSTVIGIQVKMWNVINQSINWGLSSQLLYKPKTFGPRLSSAFSFVFHHHFHPSYCYVAANAHGPQVSIILSFNRNRNSSKNVKRNQSINQLRFKLTTSL